MAITRADLNLCIGCGNCVNTCPMDVFRMDDTAKKSVIAYPKDCQVCGMCIVYCPIKEPPTIIVTPEKDVTPMTCWR